MGGGAGKNKKPNTAPAASSSEAPAAKKEPTAPFAGTPDGCKAVNTALRDLQTNAEDSSDILLSSHDIEDAGVAELAKSLTKSTRLEVLNLSINRLSDASADALSQALPDTKLKVLMLERNNLTAAGVSTLAKSLPPTLDKLGLGRNAVGSDGTRALAASVSRLHTLNLGFADLHPEGAQALGPLLTKITVLDVSGNHLGGHGCTFLADKLADSACSLETLKLESNGVGDAGAKSLSTALEKNKKLLVLEVRRNSVTDVGTKALALALEKNRTLKHLDLFDNSITDIGASALLVSVKKAKQAGSMLTKLDLEINDVSSVIITQISEVLRK